MCIYNEDVEQFTLSDLMCAFESIENKNVECIFSEKINNKIRFRNVKKEDILSLIEIILDKYNDIIGVW